MAKVKVEKVEMSEVEKLRAEIAAMRERDAMLTEKAAQDRIAILNAEQQEKELAELREREAIQIAKNRALEEKLAKKNAGRVVKTIPEYMKFMRSQPSLSVLAQYISGKTSTAIQSSYLALSLLAGQSSIATGASRQMVTRTSLALAFSKGIDFDTFPAEIRANYAEIAAKVQQLETMIDFLDLPGKIQEKNAKGELVTKDLNIISPERLQAIENYKKGKSGGVAPETICREVIEEITDNFLLAVMDNKDTDATRVRIAKLAEHECQKQEQLLCKCYNPDLPKTKEQQVAEMQQYVNNTHDERVNNTLVTYTNSLAGIAASLTAFPLNLFTLESWTVTEPAIEATEPEVTEATEGNESASN